MSETWLDRSIEDTLIALEGYNLYRQDRTTCTHTNQVKRGGGLAVYTSINCVVNTNKYANLCCCNEHYEFQVLSIKPKNDRESVIINAYHPPKGSIEFFLNQLTVMMDTISRERYADIYLMGDLNIDHSNEVKNNAANNLKSMMSSYGFTQMINKPTRRTLLTRTLIDVIYIRSDKNFSTILIPVTLSDHYLVAVSRFLNYITESKKEIYGRTYRHYSEGAVLNYFKRIDRSCIFMMHDVDMVWSELYRIILNCANSICPFRVMKVKPSRLPWITREIVELLQDRDDAFLDAVTNNKPGLLNNARDLKTESKRAIRTAHSEYVQSQLAEYKSNPKKFWAEVKNLMNKKAIQPKIELNDNDGNQVPCQLLPDFINEYFATIGPKLAARFSSPGDTKVHIPQASPVSPHRSDSDFHFDVVTESQVLKELKKIN